MSPMSAKRTRSAALYISDSEDEEKDIGKEEEIDNVDNASSDEDAEEDEDDDDFDADENAEVDADELDDFGEVDADDDVDDFGDLDADDVDEVDEFDAPEAEGQECAADPDPAPAPKISKSVNVAALVSGNLVVRRQALLPKVLCVADGAAVGRGAFKSPIPGSCTNATPELHRRLLARKRFVPWHSRQPFVPLTNLQGPEEDLPPAQDLAEPDAKNNEDLPPGFEPLVLWQAECADDSTLEAPSIVVDPVLTKFLRPHQREGVQFMFECVAGLRAFSKTEEGELSCSGCILADDMGLGKTLQSITLLWTLLRQGFDGSPLSKRVLIVTPTSLVSNWESELNKWLDGRVNVMAVGESTRAEVVSGISNFLSSRNPYQVMIISYETFRLHATKFQNEGSCDLLICDEAHRLKNDQTLTNQALASLHCRRRVLLSGTPMQNDLEEFYAMVNFTNPGILGNAAAFRRYYENPILTGREPDASDEARALSAERSAELSEIVNQFILRRTNSLLSNHLPPKIVQVVCCKLTDLQIKLYQHFIQSKNVRQVLEDKTKRAKVLASITALKKLCNHPKLIYDSLCAGGSQAAGFEDCMKYFPPGLFTTRMGTASPADGSWIELSGKMGVLARLLANIRQTTDDRIVLVSNYTQTLDIFTQICRERSYPFVRLDGTTSLSKRQKLVLRFNDPSQNEFVFLLSSKAGGCGLNLIGGNRLVLFDPDWNPATDKQAAARVWRDGQKKRVYLYRFLATGTIEEKVYQRQISKEGLQKVVDKEQNAGGKAQVNDISTEDLRDLFTLREDTRSDTHETLGCTRCEADDNGNDARGDQESDTSEYVDIGRFAEVAGCLDKLQPREKQIGNPSEEDLKSWAHHADSSTIPDALLQVAAGGQISFAFTCQVDGKLAPVESAPDRRICSTKETVGVKLRERSDPLHAVTINTGLVASQKPSVAAGDRPSTTPSRTSIEPPVKEYSSKIPSRVNNVFVGPERILVPRSTRSYCTPIKRNFKTRDDAQSMKKKPAPVILLDGTDDDEASDDDDDDDASDEDFAL